MTIYKQTPIVANYPVRAKSSCKLLCQGGLPTVTTPETNDICICDFITCEYSEKVFADPTSTDYWKNDENEFLFKKLIAGDTIDIELFKSGVKVADLNDNTLGTLFDGFASGSAEQQLYKGFLIDWKLVESAHGVGTYTINAQLNILGNVSEFVSRKFNLCIYSDLNANGTVRIESTQNGNIIGSEFDFTDLNWYQSIRIAGTFGNPTPVYEEDRYVTETRKVRQIKDKMSREWDLKTYMIPYEVANHLVYNKLLANEILITDYQIVNESIWRRVGVFPKEISKSELVESQDRTYAIKFIDNKDIFIKRNF